MNKKICIQEDRIMYYVILIIFIVIVIFYFFYQYNFNRMNDENEKSQMLLSYKINNLENTMKESKKDIESYHNRPTHTQPVYTQPVPTLINNNPKRLNSLDRVYNPLRFPYKSDNYYDQSWYPNMNLPSQVIGCGGRNQPCMGGTQVPIMNPSTPIDISNTGIAPVNISTRGPLGEPQQMSTLYKIKGDEHDTLPLFGRKKYPNDNKYEYYTLSGRYGSKVKIITKNKNDELGTNDIVFLQGRSEPYTCTIYESDFPQYIPYM